METTTSYKVQLCDGGDVFIWLNGEPFFSPFGLERCNAYAECQLETARIFHFASLGEAIEVLTGQIPHPLSTWIRQIGFAFDRYCERERA